MTITNAATARAATNDGLVAEVLLRGPKTLDEIGLATGIKPSTIRKYVFPRLRERGLPVEVVDVFKPDRQCGAQAAFWAIVLPRGRVCAHDGCGTVLRSTNPSDRCERHGGGFLDWETEYEPVRTPVRRCNGYGKQRPHRTDDFSNGTHLCRSCYRAYRREYDARKKREAV